MNSSPPFSSRTQDPRPGTSAADIAAWRRVLDHRSPRAPGRKLLAFAFLSLAAASLLWTGVAATAGCPDPIPALPSPLTKFCPDTPAYAEDMNQNFAQLASWLAKFAGPVGGDIDDGWLKSANIHAMAIQTKHITPGSVTGANIKNGSIRNNHITAGTLTKSKLSLAPPTSTTTLRKINPACLGNVTFAAISLADRLGDTDTCAAVSCSGASCPSGQNRYYQCGTFNCGACSSSAPVCTNPLVGYLVQ